MSVAKTIQGMQGFLGYLTPAKPAQASLGEPTRLAGDGEVARVDFASALQDYVADETLLGSISALQDAVPDLALRIEDTLVDGDRIALRFSVSHEGDGKGRGLAPGILIYRVAKGKIVEHWMQPDATLLLRKLEAAAQ